ASTPIQVSVYEDRLMVWNEGKLPEELTVEMLKTKHPSLPRNPILAETCFKGGLIEAWGRGTVRVIDECIKYGLPAPSIKIIGGGLAVILYKDKYHTEYLEKFGLNSRQLDAINYLREHEEIKNADYRKLFDISGKTAFRDLETLVSLGFLSKEGEKKGTVYRLHVR
ncbi:MAG: transcriptional regulator, partial [Cytophagales bacterium]|nr:transcriptional regulator [Cytophagales bacterium]